MTAEQRAALVAELEDKRVATLLAMVIVELLEVRAVLEAAFVPTEGEDERCVHPEDRRVPGGMGTGIKFHCLECGYEART